MRALEALEAGEEFWVGEHAPGRRGAAKVENEDCQRAAGRLCQGGPVKVHARGRLQCVQRGGVRTHRGLHGCRASVWVSTSSE